MRRKNHYHFEPGTLGETRKSLISRLRNWEDRDSWQEFFDRYWRLIYSVAIKAGLTPTEALRSATVDAATAGQTISNTASLTAVDQADTDGANDSASAAVRNRLPGPALLAPRLRDPAFPPPREVDAFFFISPPPVSMIGSGRNEKLRIGD